MKRTSIRHGGSLPIVVLMAGALAFPAVRLAAEQATRPHVERLAASDLEGRLTGTRGAQEAASYLVTALQRIGARPLPGRDSFLLPFDFTAGVRDTGTAVTLTAPASRAWTGAAAVQPLSFSDSATVSGPVVFAGYGLTVPDSADFGYDSYATIDVKDKIVMVLRYVPEDVDQKTRVVLNRYAGLRYKALVARERGARGLLVVTGPRSPNAGETIPLAFDTAAAGSGLVVASVSGEVAAEIFRQAPDGRTLDAAQRALDGGNPHVPGFALPGVELTIDVKVQREIRTDHNVVGYLPASNGAGRGAVAKPYVILGAHYDHLGHGRDGNSLARQGEAGQIHPGADDNASGVAAVLAAGSQLAGLRRSRAVVLAFWSGEELGLLGSSEFVTAPPIPLDQVAAYVNFDMVGRMRDNRLTLQATGTSAIWPRLIEQVNVPVGFDVQLQADPYLPTDVMSFNQAAVPSLALFTGSHEDYHRPTDVAAGVNFEDLDRVARFGALMAQRLANLDTPPEFIKVERTSEAMGDRASLRAFTGTIPDYTTEVEGLRLSGVVEGGPAAEAGLKAGDVIVEFGGQAIKNIYDYTYALDAVKVDVPVRIVFLRDGQRHEVVLTPRARK